MSISKPACVLTAVLLAAAHPARAGDTEDAVQAALDLKEWMTLVKPEEAGSVSGISKKPARCLEVLAGRDDGETLALRYAPMSVADARAMCEQVLVDARAFEAAVGGREDAARDAIVAKYAAAGIKGDRLKLFVDNELNGGGFAWYGKGCATEITDPKALKKAKKLFQWTNGSNGSTLVTKYTFKGNRYKVTSREFYSTAKAQRWCR